jgi:S-adenosylmethionine:tRNA ribosyltransferase-isomerase
MITVEDFDYELPPDRIAQEPVEPRDRSRLLVIPPTGSRVHEEFRRIGSHLRPGDLLVLNDTRVVPARIALARRTGGRVDGLVLGPAGAPDAFHAFLRSNSALREGEILGTVSATPGAAFRLVARGAGGRWTLETVSGDLEELLRTSGRAPLPPYIRRAPGSDRRDPEDLHRYQTVFARVPGAVAAPTAGLHFTEGLLSDLSRAGIETCTVTLHVGPGTFLPVRSTDLSRHRMEAEYFEIPEETASRLEAARRERRRTIAVGTTTCRALEGSRRSDGSRRSSGWTDLFIRPPHAFHGIDGLVTNFHMPRSTLLMLVAAFAGRERILAAYREAIEAGYRFYSFGDAMLVFPGDSGAGAPRRGEAR